MSLLLDLSSLETAAVHLSDLTLPPSIQVRESRLRPHDPHPSIHTQTRSNLNPSPDCNLAISAPPASLPSSGLPLSSPSHLHCHIVSFLLSR